MPLNTTLIGELKHEAASTKKMLERVPNDKFNWKPHEKSMQLGKLAKHVAELNMWVKIILETGEFDFATGLINRPKAENTADVLQIFEEKLNEAVQALEAATDDDLNALWTVRRGGQLMFQMPKKVALRSFGYNHIYHHRGQLSVYLRLLDVPIPGMYGPSADEGF